MIIFPKYALVKKVFIILLATIFILPLSGCKLADKTKPEEMENIGDGGFLTGQPCGPPCFWGIYPGSTSEKQLLTILQDKGIDNECERFDRTQEGGREGIICLYNILIILAHDKVEEIGFTSTEKITVGEAITNFGDPNHILVAITSTPEYPRTTMMLFFDDIQTSLVLPEQKGISYLIDSDVEIVNIGYSDKESYLSTTKTLPKWSGYIKYGQTQ